MSSVEALNGFKIEVDLVLKIIKDYTSLMKAGKVIEFCWIPSHVNIRGNDRAHTAAKDALSLPPTGMKLPASELKPCISRFCLEEWLDIWNCAANNKLHAIYATAGNPVQNNLVSRRDAVIRRQTDDRRTADDIANVNLSSRSLTRYSSGDEIANVNFLYDDNVHTLYDSPIGLLHNEPYS